MESGVPRRLEITLKHPNPIFESWLERWHVEAQKRNSASQHNIREALISLRSFPLPLASGRDCAILRGFGPTLCNLIDKELDHLRSTQANAGVSSSNLNITFEEDVQKLVAEVKRKNTRKQSPRKKTKITKKQQQLLDEERERLRQVRLCPGQFRIVLLVDIQETSGKKKRLLDQTRSYLENLKVEYEVRRLTLGDFLWIARDFDGNELVLPYIVERKRMDDLSSSIRDGRFHEQKHRLRQCGLQNVIYLVEDYGKNEHLGMPLTSLMQAMSNTQIQSGFNIVHTENHWRSMVYLQGMTRTLIELYKDKFLFNISREEVTSHSPNESNVGLMKFKDLYENSARNAQLTVREVFVQQLLQLHSLSLEKAMAIVEIYPTPRLLFDAYQSCSDEQESRRLLAQIRCGKLERPLGEKLSQIIYDFYKTEF